ncbi:MAG: TetR/AcrR family transcriptional regulator [Ignavibacteriae bacterium]|nr:TetR/AcrR family transcriptional regulator [Ignavibacteriota bacterium]
MASIEHQSEDTILKAAQKVFLKRGFHGTRMQEIADEAGINKALLHYYFRSKDKIFEAIFSASFKHFLPQILEILDSDEPFEQKINTFFSKYIDLLQKHPHIPNFIMHEVAHNPERLQSFFRKHFETTPAKFLKQIKDEMDAGIIERQDPRQILVSMLALAIFPFAAKPIIQFALDMSEDDFKSFIQDRKKFLPEFVMKSLRKI